MADNSDTEGQAAQPGSVTTRPAEKLKQSIAACSRAVSQDRQLDVEFVAGEFEFDARQNKLSSVTDNASREEIALSLIHI